MQSKEGMSLVDMPSSPFHTSRCYRDINFTYILIVFLLILVKCTNVGHQPCACLHPRSGW